MLNNVTTLKSTLLVTKGCWKWHHSHSTDCIRVFIGIPLSLLHGLCHTVSEIFSVE